MADLPLVTSDSARLRAAAVATPPLELPTGLPPEFPGATDTGVPGEPGKPSPNHWRVGRVIWRWATTGLQLVGLWCLLLLVLAMGGYFVIGPGGRGPIAGLDHAIARFVADQRASWWTSIARTTPVIVTVVVAAALLSVARSQWLRAAVAAAIAIGGAIAAGLITKVVIARPRPSGSLTAMHDRGFSFPSDHTLFIAAAAGVTAVLARSLPNPGARRWRWPLAGVAVAAVAGSRLALGVHWTSDVLTAAACGSAWAVLVTHHVLRIPTRNAAIDDALPSRSRRARRPIAAIAVGLVALPSLVVVGWSWGRSVTASGTEPLGAASVDWLRTHGGAGAVNWVENYWYTRHPPATVAIAPHVRHPFLSYAPGPYRFRTQDTRGARPARVHTVVHPMRRGEGVWQPATVTRRKEAPLYTAYWRPDPRHTGVIVGALWINTKLTRPQLVAGTQEPGGTGWPWAAHVPLSLRNRVVAAFNAGFLFKAADGGFYENGRIGKPLHSSAASFVVHRNGSVELGAWNRSVRMTPDVVAIRQNLHLVVDHGTTVPGLESNSHSAFGNRRNQHQFTWRSGLGIDRRGDLVYVAGKDLDLATLADALAQAGAVKAMELDIHPTVVTANLFRYDAAKRSHVDAARLLPNMTRPATRYLQPDRRDFIAIELR